MGRAESVVDGFGSFRKTRDTAIVPELAHGLAPAGEYFMWVRLMPDVPDNAVIGGIENVMQGNRQLYRTQIG